MTDTNIKNYSIQDLMDIYDIDTIDPAVISTKTTHFIKQLINKPEMISFFHTAQNRLLEESGNTLVEGMSSMKNENNEDNSDATNPDTNNDVPSADEPAWFSNKYNPTSSVTILPVAKGKMNPNLTNIITRFVNIDSQYRDYSSTFDVDSTDFTLCLSERLSNVLSMRLFSYQIPYTWFLIDAKQGNNCFWISMNNNELSEAENGVGARANAKIVAVIIPNGNYSYIELETQIATSLSTAGFTIDDSNVDICSINPNTRIMTLHLFGVKYGEYVINENNTMMIFFDPTKSLSSHSNCGDIAYLNHTFGWLCGFRKSHVDVLESGNVAIAAASLTSTKYLTLVVDDFNQNHVNNAMVTISNLSSSVKMPSFSRSTPVSCNSNQRPLTEEIGIIDTLPPAYVNTHTFLPSAPRTLTNNQLYSMNQIKINKSKVSYRMTAPSTQDILSIIPFKPTTETGSLLVDLTGSLQESVRNYFGPVNIDKMRVRLLDDKGRQLNLNGNDWSITLICDCLYQY